MLGNEDVTILTVKYDKDTVKVTQEEITACYIIKEDELTKMTDINLGEDKIKINIPNNTIVYFNGSIKEGGFNIEEANYKLGVLTIIITNNTKDYYKIKDKKKLEEELRGEETFKLTKKIVRNKGIFTKHLELWGE